MDNVILVWALTSGIGLLITSVYFGMQYADARQDSRTDACYFGIDSTRFAVSREREQHARGQLVVGWALAILAPLGLLAILLRLARLVPPALRWLGGGIRDGWRLLCGRAALPTARSIKNQGASRD